MSRLAVGSDPRATPRPSAKPTANSPFARPSQAAPPIADPVEHGVDPVEERPHAIRMAGITKRFGSTVANDRVDFDLECGEVHALLGENGAGKSTLMGIMFGLLIPDEGTITHGHEQVRFTSPAHALRRGIGMVHQHFMLVPTLTVTENIVMGSQPSRDMRYRRRQLEAAVGEIVERHELGVDSRAMVGDLSVEDQQRVEITRLLYRGAQTLILDEPTAALSSAQVKKLLATLRDLQASGRSIVIVTHKLEDVIAIADRATVLKAGRNVTTCQRSGFERRALTSAMFDEIPDPVTHTSKVSATAPVQLAIRGLTVTSRGGRAAVRDLDLMVYSGEVLGVAGVAGNGQPELVQALAGVATATAGTIELDGVDITRHDPLARRAFGVRVIPEDRHHAGLVLDMTIAENLALTMVPAGMLSRRGLLRRREMHAMAARLCDAFDIRPRDPNQRVRALSGGNQQKVVVARELSGEPRLLVASSPTRGLDLSAASSIHKEIDRARSRGCAIILISPDLDEVLTLADRVAVIFAGRIVADVSRDQVSIRTLGEAMVGQAAQNEWSAADPTGRDRKQP